MSFWKEWLKFIKENASRHMKRISISVGSFLVLLITSVPIILNNIDYFIFVVWSGVIVTSTTILMTLFGKNGNGNNNTVPEYIGKSESLEPTVPYINLETKPTQKKEVPI